MPGKTTDDAKLPFPPYGGFVNFLNDLAAMEVLPNRLNQQVFGPSYSGSARWQILRAFRFFDLMAEDGIPNPFALAPLLDTKTRQEALATLLREHYKGLFDLPLATAGPAEVNGWFNGVGLDTATTRKAKSFFLAAAQDNGIPLHQLVASGRKVRTGRGRRKGGKGGKKDEQITPPVTPPSGEGSPRLDGSALFHPAIDAFLREARKLTEHETWTKEARDFVVQGFTTQLDLFLPVKAKGRAPRSESVPKSNGAAES